MLLAQPVWLCAGLSTNTDQPRNAWKSLLLILAAIPLVILMVALAAAFLGAENVLAQAGAGLTLCLLVTAMFETYAWRYNRLKMDLVGMSATQ